jgi:hypothetical protein
LTLAVGTFLAALPGRWAELMHPAPLTRAHLEALGWPLRPYAALTFGTELVFTAAYCLVGWVIFARRSGEGMALFTAFLAVAFGVGNHQMTLSLEGLRSYPPGALLTGVLGFLGWVAFTHFPYVFPSGRYVPRWTWLPAWGWAAISFGWNLLPGTAFDPTRWRLYGPVALVLLTSMVYSLVYRYSRVSTAIERQQTKWVWYGAAVILAWEIAWIGGQALVGNQVIAYVGWAGGDPPTPGLFAVVRAVQTGSRLVYLALPVTLGIAILRYRLWDIDLLIRRTLIYSAVSALLALVYFGSVLSLEGVVRRATGGESPVVIVLSTLLIAALAAPLRRWVQAAVDRRFYRRKYDAARVLAAFGANLRDETDLARLSARLAGVVDETMQPAHTSLWLRGSGTQGTLGA